MKFNKTIVSGVCLAFLSACGGGGGDSPSPSPTQPQSQKFSQSDVQDTAESGFAVLDVTGKSTAYLIGYFAGTIQGLATDTGGSRALITPCASGTGTLQLNKLTAHTGLAVGDELTFTFNKCSTNSSVLDGAAKLTVRAAVSPSTTDVNATYDASLTQFSVNEGGVAKVFNGMANIRLSTTGSVNSVTSTLAVPAGQKFTVVRGGVLTVEYQAGTNHSQTATLVPNSASRRLDGTVRIQSSTDADTFSIKTPTPLAGTLVSNASGGSFVPTSGVFEVTDLGRNLSTSTTISGINAQVSGDTDQNGTRDLSFTVLASTLLN